LGCISGKTTGEVKIVHINLAKTWRGGERQVFLLMRGLQEEKIDQVLICRKGSALENEANKAGLTTHAFPKRPFSSLFQASILKKLEAKGFDIVHCHESEAQTLGILGKVLWKTNQKLIVHRRVIFPIKNKPTTAFKYSEKNILRMICISKAVEESVKNSIGFKNTVVVPSMIELKHSSKPENDFRRKWNIKSEYLIGYIAALTAEKDHITFLKTAEKIINSSDLDVHFVIVGEGQLKEKLLKYAEELGISDKVTFTGFVPNAQEIIPEIDVLLFTSIAEGLGTTILDFFVAKKPVVATKSGGAEELVLNGETGYLCNARDYHTLAEKVIFLLKNRTKTEEIVDKALKFAGNFSISSVTSKTIEVYKSVL